MAKITAAAIIIVAAAVVNIAGFVNIANAADGKDGKDAAVNQLFDAFDNSGAPLDDAAAESQKMESLTKLNAAVRGRLIAEVAAVLDEDGRLPVYGDGGITIYEFSDYQCGYCRRVFSFLDAAAARGEIKIKVIELPVLGETSEKLAKVALAAWQQGKYENYHRLLMRIPPPKTAEDMALLNDGLEADDAAIEEMLRRNFAVANLLGVRGTPAFIINGRYIGGAINEEQFRRLIAE